MNLYSYQSVDKLIEHYCENGGDAVQTDEGTLGSGDWILFGLAYSFVIKEVYLNPWSSAHKVRRYKNLPKKYLSVLK